MGYVEDGAPAARCRPGASNHGRRVGLFCNVAAATCVVKALHVGRIGDARGRIRAIPEAAVVAERRKNK
jgi:hypothetical protein